MATTTTQPAPRITIRTRLHPDCRGGGWWVTEYGRGVRALGRAIDALHGEARTAEQALGNIGAMGTWVFVGETALRIGDVESLTTACVADEIRDWRQSGPEWARGERPAPRTAHLRALLECVVSGEYARRWAQIDAEVDAEFQADFDREDAGEDEEDEVFATTTCCTECGGMLDTAQDTVCDDCAAEHAV